MKFRAVDIPIMAAPSEQKVGLAVQVKKGSTCLLSTLKTFRMSQSLQEVFDCFDLDVAGEVMKAEAADRPSGPWRSIDMQETVMGGKKKKKKRPTDPLWKKLRATKQFFFLALVLGSVGIVRLFLLRARAKVIPLTCMHRYQCTHQVYDMHCICCICTGFSGNCEAFLYHEQR